MKLLKNILFLSLFVISCQNANNKNENQLVTFDLKDPPKIANVKLSDLGFIDIEYIPLETNAKSVISMIMISKIEFGNGFFLIHLLNNRILKFQNDGLFATSIGTIGRGPNEFLVAHDIEIDVKNQKIYLVDGWAKKFYVYSESGEFIRTFQCPLNTIYFKITENGILCYSTNYHADIEYSYNIIDFDGKIIKSFPNRYRWNIEVQRGTAIIDENLFYRFNGMLLKKEVYSDTVYAFENMDFKPHLVIKHGGKLLTTQARSDFGPLYLFENFVIQKNLFEFGDYIYYEYANSRVLYSLIGSKKNDFQVFVKPQQGLTNDLDGGPNIVPKTVKDDNTIIGCVDAIKLKAHVASEAFKNSTPKYPKKKKDLEKLANSLKETDNPIIVIAKYKK